MGTSRARPFLVLTGTVVLLAACAAVSGLDRLQKVDCLDACDGAAPSPPADAAATSPDGPISRADTGGTPSEGGLTSPEAGAGSPDSGPTSPYRSAILADTPLAYWRFDEQSGTSAGDATGNGNAAAAGTGVTWNAPGALLNDPDTAAHLSGAEGFELATVSQFDFPGNSGYSLEAWVSSDTAFDGQYRHLFAKDDPTADAGRQEYGVYLESPEGLVFERWVRGVAKKVVAPLPPLNQWTYVVVTYDGSEMVLYVNASKVGTQADGRSQAPKDLVEFLGCREFDYVSLEGTIDEFAIYGYALGANQVAAHWSASGR